MHSVDQAYESITHKERHKFCLASLLGCYFSAIFCTFHFEMLIRFLTSTFDFFTDVWP